MVINLCFLKKKMKNMKNLKALCYYTHFTSKHTQFLYTVGYISHILHLDIIKSEIHHN